MKTPPPAKLNPKPMLDAQARLDAKRKEIADFETLIKKQERDLEEAIATGDPTNESEALQVAVLRSKISMAPNYLRREVDKVPTLLKTFGREVGRFEAEIIAAGVAESDSWLETLEKVFLPYCPAVRPADSDHPFSTVRGVVCRSPIFNLIPAHPAAFGEEPLALSALRGFDGEVDEEASERMQGKDWRQKRAEMVATEWENRASEFEAALRGRMATLLLWAERHAKQGGRFVPDPIPTVLRY